MKRLFLVLLFVAVSGCAVSVPTTYRFVNMMKLHEAHEFRPEPDRLKGDSHWHYWEPLVAAVEKRGGRVVVVDMDVEFPEYADTEFEILGYYTGIDHPVFLDKQILINHNLQHAPNRMIATLLHEIGHLVSPGYINPDMGDHDVWSEAFAAMVAERIGLDIYPQSFYYLSQFSHRYAVLEFYAKELDKAVKELLEDIL